MNYSSFMRMLMVFNSFVCMCAVDWW